ncbi:MAG: macro domain-containing protein [Actinobacteria bacterium]|nr:macro domain-containing protein [Actinomycetota bacterium]
MITYQKGNLLDARVDALVNTVNEVGVMGKGIALQFREAYPESAREYMEAAQRGAVRVGHVLVTPSHSLMGPQWIIHFPTKRHWRQPSKLEWIKNGLDDLARVLKEIGVHSVALPPLGCGNGRLDWREIKPIIEKSLASLTDVEIVVFEPSMKYQTEAKNHGVEKLTPARALVAEAIRRYSVLGLGCTNLEVQKLAWFLQRALLTQGRRNPLRLTFAANKYGPYSDQLRHLLNALDGSYLHSDKRLSEAAPADLIFFRDERRNDVTKFLEGPATEYVPALDTVTELIDGFESPLGMELLATIDWLLTEKNCEPTVEAIKQALVSWPGGANAGQRKLEIFDDRMIELALDRYGQALSDNDCPAQRLC